MKISRRDILKFVGGSAAGFLFTPVPWKVLDDTAIWTQNWPWMQRPPRGRLRTRYTACPLCPAGCPVKAVCIGEVPVALKGVASGAEGSTALCPAGLCAHHLPFHPARVPGAAKIEGAKNDLKLRQVELDHLLNELAGLIKGPSGGVAVLDRQPGRSVSRAYRQFLARFPRGFYLTPAAHDQDVFAAYRSMLQQGPFGLDLARTATIISFGAPILEMWGDTGRRLTMGEKNPDVIQAETRRSRTAMRAPLWLPIKPGSEASLALGLAHVIVRERLSNHRALERATDGPEYAALVDRFTPDAVSETTGLSPQAIKDAARRLCLRKPSLAIGGGDPASGPLSREAELAIAGLNFLWGSVGTEGGVVCRKDPSGIQDLPEPISRLDEVPDGSIRLLILDGAESGYAFPWHLLERKLDRDNAAVVSLSPYFSGMARLANYIVPAPAAYETLTDLPDPFSSSVATLTLSSRLVSPVAPALEPAEFIRRLGVAAGLGGESIPAAGEEIRRRADAIFADRRGSVRSFADGKITELQSLSSPDEFWNLLIEGGSWRDEEAAPAPPARFSFLGSSRENRGRLEAALHSPSPDNNSITLLPFADGECGSGQVSPVMTKLYRESGLRASARTAFLNPVTAKACGCSGGGTATLATKRGVMEVEIREDRGVMPGTVQLPVTPDVAAFDPSASLPAGDVLELCGDDEGHTWGTTTATLKGGLNS